MAKATTKCALPNPRHPYTWLSSRLPEVCEKTFSASFVPQPAENTTFHYSLTQITWAWLAKRRHSPQTSLQVSLQWENTFSTSPRSVQQFASNIDKRPAWSTTQWRGIRLWTKYTTRGGMWSLLIFFCLVVIFNVSWETKSRVSGFVKTLWSFSCVINCSCKHDATHARL